MKTLICSILFSLPMVVMADEFMREDEYDFLQEEFLIDATWTAMYSVVADALSKRPDTAENEVLLYGIRQHGNATLSHVEKGAALLGGPSMMYLAIILGIKTEIIASWSFEDMFKYGAELECDARAKRPLE